MVNGRDLLIKALENSIANFAVTNEQKRILNFDNTEYKAFLTNFNSPKDISQLTEAMIDKLAGNLDALENKQTFVATIRFLKGLAELSQSDGASVPLNSNQLAVINELKKLIEQTIKKNEALIAVYSETSEKTNEKYIKVLELLTSDRLIKAEDYDLVEEVVFKLCSKDNGPVLDDLMTYMNERNSKKLKAIYLGDKKEPEDIKAVQESPMLKKMRKTDKEQEEMMSKLNVKLTGFVAKTKKKVNTNKALIKAEKTQKIKEILSYLGYNYDNLPNDIKAELVATEDVDKLDTFAHYIKEKNPIIINRLKENNIRALVYILISSSQLVVEKVLHNLTYVYNLSDDEIARIINLMPTIFGIKYYENFLANLELIKDTGADISAIVNSSLLLFIADNKAIKNHLKKVSRYGANLKLIIETCAMALLNNLIPRNLNILEMYGFNLTEFFNEKESCYILLNSKNLETKLDGLIEVGLNEYIHNSSNYAGNSFRTLIIKRVYYAFKNNLKIWDNNLYNTNSEYNEWIKKSDLVISDSMISLLIAEHPLLEVIDEGYRPAIYSATPLALLKRKTELLFTNQTISRLKAYRIFKILTDQGVKDNEAMLYALTYNTSLDATEYVVIQNAVERAGDDHD